MFDRPQRRVQFIGVHRICWCSANADIQTITGKILHHFPIKKAERRAGRKISSREREREQSILFQAENDEDSDWDVAYFRTEAQISAKIQIETFTTITFHVNFVDEHWLTAVKRKRSEITKLPQFNEVESR